MNNEIFPINIKDKFKNISEHWTPKIIAKMNSNHLKLAKIQGEFVWHLHQDTDEVFIVIDGEMKIDFRDDSVDIISGELFVVPKGVEHKPYAKNECMIMLIESAGTINTGDAGGERTADNSTWI